MALGSRVPRHGSSPFLDRLPPWLARRLGVLAGPVPEDPAQDRPLIARSLAFLFLVGASLSSLAGDMAGAIAHLDAILEANPDQAQAKQMRDELLAEVR